MNTNRTPRLIISILVLLAVAAAAYWFFFIQQPAAAAAGVLTASGTVETTEISIAPEVSGKILEVDVQEGDAVKKGEVLFRLDDSLIKAQRNVAAVSVASAKGAVLTAQAAVASAQAQFDITYNTALTQDKSTTRTSNWVSNPPSSFTLPNWYFSQTEQLNAAQAEVTAAEAALTASQTNLTNVLSKVSSADFVKAETELGAAQAAYTVANNLHTRLQNGTAIDDLTRRQLFLMFRNSVNIARGRDPKYALPNNLDQNLTDAGQQIFDDATSALNDAQQAYDDALTTQGAADVLKARADVSVAQERVYTAQDYVRILQTGVNSPSVSAAEKVMEQTQAAVGQAQTAVDQAQANLDLIDAQVAKLTVTAPVDGVVLTRAAEPGSVVNAGGVMLTLGRLDELTITVYMPEDRVGEVSLTQVANVTVDSFPGVTFKATVSFISDQAEFTPRNVQTVEGRKNTVFAVKLKLDNTGGQLKPGMPADVVFANK